MVLIPKVGHPRKVSNFRMISLSNVNYKVITKLLANRLKLVLHNLISRVQCGFIPGSTPIDNILAVREIVHFINQDYSITPRMLIKIDIEKAYDMLN